MKKLIFSMLMTALLIFTFSCEKETTSDNSTINPLIQFVSDSTSVVADTAIPQGISIRFHIKATANGGNNLTNLVVTSNDTTSILNFGFNAVSLEKDVIITKNASETEILKFTIRNSSGLSKTISIKLTKNGTQFGSINFYKNITLGAQNNSTLGSFFSLQNGLVYLQSDAFANQGLIDILYYYNSVDNGCLASPGANIIGIFSGTSSPDNWTTINTTYFGKSSINGITQNFDNAINDSLILANKFTSSGRKAKPIAAGQIWSFQNQAGKYGLVKILSLSGQESGNITFDIQVQK